MTGLEAGQGCDVKARDPMCLSDAKCDTGKRQCSECLSFLFLLASFRAVRVMHGSVYYCFRGTDGCDDSQTNYVAAYRLEINVTVVIF